MITYFKINLLLGLTYFLFLMLQKFNSFIKSKSSPLSSLRCAQFLVFLSIVIPLLMNLIPNEQLPIIEQVTYQALPEGSYKLFRLPSEKTFQVMREAQVQNRQYQKTYFDFIFLIQILIALGFMYFLGRFFWNYFRIYNLLKRSTTLRKSSRVQIVVSEEVSVPFSVRMINSSWVVIPIELMSIKKDFHLSIKHEIQHHRQGDTLWSMIVELISCFFFFNPAMYFWKNNIIELQEYSCDDALTGQKDVSSLDYGSCLLRVAETALSNRQMYVGTTSMAAILKNSKYFKTFLLRRIEMIMEEKKSRRKWISTCTAFVIGLLTVAIAFGAEKIGRDFAKKINPGKIVVDKDIQKIADEVLLRAVKRTKATSGFVIVAEPATGKILAVANLDVKGERNGHWILNQLMEPASLAKSLVMAKAIDLGRTTPTEKHSCEKGQYHYKGSVYRDWKEEGWEKLSTTDALAVSSDICSIKIGEKVGDEGLSKMLLDFGFGPEGVASEFPEALAGELPSIGSQYIPQVTIGFGFKASPLEILQAYGAIANGGNLMKPIGSDAKEQKIIRRILSEESAKQMRGILEKVVLEGTGKNRASSDLYTTAGKTASARINEFLSIDWYGGNKYANIAGFIGFAPVKNPRVEVYVGLINPDTGTKGAHGSEHAAPVFKEMIENVLTHLKVAPDKI